MRIETDVTAQKMEAKCNLLSLLDSLGILSAERSAHVAWTSHMNYILSYIGSNI